MFEPVNASNIKDAVQKVFSSELCLDSDSISLFEILNIFHEIKADQKRVKDEIEEKLDEKFKSINTKYSITIQDFDEYTNNICVVLKNDITKERIKFYFEKNNGVLEISKIKGCCKFNNILGLMGAYVEELYDYCYALKKVENEAKYNIKSVNAPFFVNISYACICIYYNKNHITSDFKIVSFYDDNLRFYFKCRNDDVTNSLKNRENEFLTNVFVKISDCPEWMQEHLIFERQLQLEEIEAAEHAKRLKQAKLAKKQKRREFLGKIFPFMKNKKG